MNQQRLSSETDRPMSTGELIQLNAALRVGDLLRQCVTVELDHAVVDVSGLTLLETFDYRGSLTTLRDGDAAYDPQETWGVRPDVLELAEQAVKNIPLDS